MYHSEKGNTMPAKTKLRGRSKPQVSPEVIQRRRAPIVVLGVDLSLKKGIAYALSVNERIVRTGIEETITKVFQHVPEEITEIIAEKMFVNNNIRVALELERVAGMLQMLCEESGIPYRQILGTTWQQPIKAAFGLNGKPADMNDREWEQYRYKKFRIYVHGFLGKGIRNSDLSNDEIAAACLALHGSREIKKTRLFGKE